jgi:hypothetical protein
MNVQLIVRTDCPDYCEWCGGCHATRHIMWGEIAPGCKTGGLPDEDYDVVICATYGHIEDDH